MNNIPQKLKFLNHSSLLIKSGDHFLLTDPWFQKPAFGSWLPTFPTYVHPVYLASLGAKLTILISHGHDDHCDNDFLQLFDSQTKIVTAKFDSPSVINRLRKLGFNNFVEVDRIGKIINGFEIKSYIDKDISHDDSLYTIKTTNSIVVHANDMWHPIKEDVKKSIIKDVNLIGKDKTYYFSQTNSASGYPLTYKVDNAKEILIEKVKGMIKCGVNNSVSLGVNNFFSYAGFASIFVKNKLYETLIPTGENINKIYYPHNERDSSHKNEIIENFIPGDELNLISGKIQKAFVSSENYNTQFLATKSELYYKKYGLVEDCDTYRISFDEDYCKNYLTKRLDKFLELFNDFILRKLDKLEGDYIYKTAIGKTFQIFCPDIKQTSTLKIGKGIITNLSKPNKKCIVDSSLMVSVIKGDILFENLYTGFEASWERYPENIYNRDIIMFLIMFTYPFKNFLFKQIQNI